ncbi:MAG: hypothetical protein FWD71_18595 [Oscillospiraceae bacterium]|nr:hypothetical protein [Oscillospiraceae bacterium]
MKIVVLERLNNNSREVKSKIRAGNIILNITSQFESNSQVSELLFRLSEQKILKTVHEETVAGTLAIPLH